MRTSITLISIAALSLSSTAGHAVSVCIGPDAMGVNGIVIYDCFGPTDPVLIEPYVIGFSSVGPPCVQGSCDDAGYGWSISASSTDPFANTGTLEGPIDHLYLWLACDNREVPTLAPNAAQFQFNTIGGDAQFLGFTLLEPTAINIGVFDQVFMAWSCTVPTPTLLGELAYFVETPVSVEESSWSSIKALYQ